jgi:transposase
MSDGSFVAPLCSFKKHEKRLAKYQRRMSRKTKFSQNWRKAKRKVQKVHTEVVNARKTFLHKATSDLSQNHAMVAIEDLAVSNMSRSAAVHSVLERIEVLTQDGPRHAYVTATNVYHLTVNGWRMVAHHASPGTLHELQEVSEAPFVLH